MGNASFPNSTAAGTIPVHTLPTAFPVHILMNELVASTGAPLPQLPQLVLGILAFVVGTDASVNSYAHLDTLD